MPQDQEQADYERHIWEVSFPRRENLLALARLMTELSGGQLELVDRPAEDPFYPDSPINKVHALCQKRTRMVWGSFYIEEFVHMATATSWRGALTRFAEDVGRYCMDFPTNREQVVDEFVKLMQLALGVKRSQQLRQKLMALPARKKPRWPKPE